MITDDSDDACYSICDSHDIKYIFQALNSAKMNYRIEALNILQNITQAKAPVDELKTYDIVTKSVILLEEGLEMNSEIGKIQAILSLHLIGNLGKASEDFTEAFHRYGCIKSLFNSFEYDDKKVLRASVSAFARLNLIERMLDVLDNEVSLALIFLGRTYFKL